MHPDRTSGSKAAIAPRCNAVLQAMRSIVPDMFTAAQPADSAPLPSRSSAKMRKMRSVDALGDRYMPVAAFAADDVAERV